MFFGIITFFLLILLLGIVFDTKATAFCSLIGCGMACVVLLYLSVVMGFGDWYGMCCLTVFVSSYGIWRLFLDQNL
ncbi:hypothetical protein L3Y34_014032 [Caenorhabditis briggsae]|uniref:Uncharacterized protein n=1 Tax=Caenorhabditis briggsae TaxID=6238 RepID=A0AAE9IWS8_CAEBR|nr:hypothetical protein L3Y34_014032 [Caenorhabditis briggsae]